MMMMMNDGRGTHGRFGTGNSYGKGRPARDVESAYLAKLSGACTPERWSKIVERAVTDAEGGNPKAREWLASYLIGRPSHTLDIGFGETPLDMDGASMEEIEKHLSGLILKSFTTPEHFEDVTEVLAANGFRFTVEKIEASSAQS